MKVHFENIDSRELIAVVNSEGNTMSGSVCVGLPLWKRILDVLIILMLLPGLLLIGMIISLIIKIGSGGAVLFRQERVGLRGTTFTCLKFRTMIENAETSSHKEHVQNLMNSKVPMTKLDQGRDPRLIPFGSVLRNTGLDELPQLINVIRGEMSIVGPRPCLPYEYELYEPWQKRRFNAAPGLTGLWQVCGKNRTTFDEMIELDVEYSEKTNLGLDLRILCLTLPAIVTQCMDARAARMKGDPLKKNVSAQPAQKESQ